MTEQSPPSLAVPFALLGGLVGLFASSASPSMALVVLVASLLTAAALAPIVADAPHLDWGGALTTKLSAQCAKLWPALPPPSDRDIRKRLFALLAGLNLGVFALFLLRALGP